MIWKKTNKQKQLKGMWKMEQNYPSSIKTSKDKQYSYINFVDLYGHTWNKGSKHLAP